MEKEEEEGTEKSVTEQALRGSRAKFVSITLPIRTYIDSSDKRGLTNTWTENGFQL